MNDDSLQQVERQLAGLQQLPPPSGLRKAVLADVHRELQAARWDRRLARTAIMLLALGVGINLAVGFQPTGSREVQSKPIARTNSRQSLLDAAVLVAQATDAATGSQIARQLAAQCGRELTEPEAAAIDAAVKSALSNAHSNGGKG